MTKYALKDIEPNPFRHVDRYPISREKVEALRESIRSTGYWGNVVARACPNGKAEVAYGHHRLAALREEYGPDHEVDLIVRKLSNEEMLQIMVRENGEDWATSVFVDHETVRAVVEAYAEGKITLPAVPKKTKTSQIRHAPSYTMGEDDLRARGDHSYTAQTLANFIGWVKPDGAAQDKVHDTLAALQFIEDKVLIESDFDGLTTKQAGAVVKETRKERKRHKDLARYHREQAEQAGNIAVAAGEQAEAAERKGRPAEIQQAKSRRRGAEQKRKTSERKAQEHEKWADHNAGIVGAAVGDKLKAGKIGIRQVTDVQYELEREATKVPPAIEEAMRSIMVQVNKRFDPHRDPLAARLEKVVEQRQFLTDEQRKEARLILRIVAGRCDDYAGKIAPKDESMKTVKAVKAAAKPATKAGGGVVYLPEAKLQPGARPGDKVTKAAPVGKLKRDSTLLPTAKGPIKTGLRRRVRGRPKGDGAAPGAT